MDVIEIKEGISYVEATDNPLSADIGIAEGNDATWLYDVGNGDKPISGLNGNYNAVLSHFHPDHIGNISKLNIKNLYLSKETMKHLPADILPSACIHIVKEPVNIDNIRIFPLPSSHAKGCLGMEVNGEYAFLGDALYCHAGKNGYTYNVQFLKQEIDTIENLGSEYLLVSHCKGLVRKRKEVLSELKAIYAKREKGNNEILIQFP